MDKNDALQKLKEQMNISDQSLKRTTDIVSVFAYLIGIRKNVFENEHEAPDIKQYEILEQNKSARIIRNLCVLRNAIEHHFKKINDEMRQNFKGLYSLPEYIDPKILLTLSNDGIRLSDKNQQLVQYIIEINRHISDRINNCKDLFPTWLNWDYVRDLFIMPDGLTRAGTEAEANKFYANKKLYPYSTYMNWTPYDCGNILSSDKRFVMLLYEWNNDEFTKLNRVEDASDYVTYNIYDFIASGRKVVFAVDCENSDPYNLCAALCSLDQEYSGKVERVILFDDIHASTAWRELERYIPMPVEHITVERVKGNKSLVDMSIAMRISREYYASDADSFVLVSSDSDYWPVIKDLPNARFLVMVEHGKCGPDIKEALTEKGIFYCFIDEFHSAKSDKFLMDILFSEMQAIIDEKVRLNFQDMLNSALGNARISMDEKQRKQFYDKHIRPFQAAIDKDGALQITLKR